MNDEDQVLAWKIDNSEGVFFVIQDCALAHYYLLVYNKLITTTLRYTPVVLEHHIPYKRLPNGKLYVTLSLSK